MLRTERLMDYCMEYKVSMREVLGPSRKHKLVKVRKTIAQDLKKTLGWSNPEIGRFINRDSTTVLYYLDKSKK